MWIIYMSQWNLRIVRKNQVTFLCDINSQESITKTLALSWQRLDSDIWELFFCCVLGSFLSYSLKQPLFLSRQTDLHCRQWYTLCCNYPTISSQRRGTDGLSPEALGKLLDWSWGTAGWQEGASLPAEPTVGTPILLPHPWRLINWGACKQQECILEVLEAGKKRLWRQQQIQSEERPYSPGRALKPPRMVGGEEGAWELSQASDRLNPAPYPAHHWKDPFLTASPWGLAFQDMNMKGHTYSDHSISPIQKDYLRWLILERYYTSWFLCRS